jgi:hypothetical protein
VPIANISDRIFDHGKQGVDELIGWLDENVGYHYPVYCEDPIVKVGDGWEIRTERQVVPEGVASRWVLDITDEQKFMLYCLRWGS